MTGETNRQTTPIVPSVRGATASAPIPTLSSDSSPWPTRKSFDTRAPSDSPSQSPVDSSRSDLATVSTFDACWSVDQSARVTVSEGCDPSLRGTMTRETMVWEMCSRIDLHA